MGLIDTSTGLRFGSGLSFLTGLGNGGLSIVASGASELLAGQVGVAVDFTDSSMQIIDNVTPANNFSGNPNNKLSYTSPSTKWILGSNGIYQSGTTLRTEYNSSGTALGVRVEEARTNSIRNNTMVGAGAPSTPPTGWSTAASGGVSWSVVGTGTEDGINYVDMRLSGTTTGAVFPSITFENSANTPAAAGQAWTQSLFVRRVAGSITNITQAARISLNQRNAAFAVIAQTQVAAPNVEVVSLKLGRFSATQSSTPVNTAYVQPTLQIDCGIGAIDITLRIGWPQLEQGAFATSPIPTTSAAVTRAADNISLATSLFPFSATAGTLFVRASLVGAVTNNRGAASISDNTSNNQFDLRFGGVAAPLSVVTAAGASRLLALWNTAGAAVDVASKVALAYASADYAAVNNGTAVTTSSTAGALPSVTTLRVGAIDGGGNQFGGHISQLMYLPIRTANSNLQALTNP